ncbi:MAG: hypothetical protein FGM61_11660 [Sediminibacterium sp.]|nr:hypothetical protein [Sediminibacterium sp.]
MRKESNFILGLLTLFLIGMIACSRTTSDEPEKLIEKIYATPNPFRNESLDSTLFSGRLNQLMTAAKETEKRSRESIRKSKTPTDKPILIEGEIFASLYEGYTGWKILDKKQSADTVWVSVEFTHKEYQQTWQDQVVCIKEKRKWKFDNVLFGKPAHLPNLQQRLMECIEMGKQEQITLLNN